MKRSEGFHASASDGPVLFRVEYDAGHGVGSTVAQQETKPADMYAFLLWQLGNPAFRSPDMNRP